MSLLVVKGNILAALPMKGWYVKLFSNVFLCVGYVYIRIYVVVIQCLYACACVCMYVCVCFSVLYLTNTPFTWTN